MTALIILLFAAGSVCAANETDAVNAQDEDLQTSVSEYITNASGSNPDLIQDSAPINTTIRSNDKNIVKGGDFCVKLTTDNGTAIANKTVRFTLNNVESTVETDDGGVAKIRVSLNPGTYTVKYSFSADGYAECKNTTDIFVITTSTSKIKASDYTAYVGVKNKFTLTLTAGGTPLAGRTVTFKINGKTITKKTNSKGKASIYIDEAKGSYNLKYYYAGEDNIKSVSGSVKVKVKKGMPTKIKRANSIIYRNKKAAYFKVRLTDSRGNLLKSKKITFKVNGKTYTKRTDSKGIAKVKIKLKTGSYKVKVYFKKTKTYNKASKTYYIKVKPKQARNNGMWLFGRDMYSVNLDKLEKYSFKHIFLNFKALELHGKKAVEKWIKSAKSHGIKVHLWFQVFYNNGKWENPVKNGKVNSKLITSKVKLAKKYAKVKGVAGVHFDYVRYPGNAHEFKNSVKAINTFVKKASKAVHKINKKLIVSAAVMPEPSGMKTYYGQDIATMSKYLDVIVPMVYKGNYHAGSNWIKSVTKAFVKQSKKAKIWTGLQSYRSDAKLKKIPAKELMSDADAAALGGAYGVILFRFALFNYINFRDV